MKLINFIKTISGKKQYEISQSEKVFLVLLGIVICALIFIQLHYQSELKKVRKGKISIQQTIGKKKTHEEPLLKTKGESDSFEQRIDFVKNKKSQSSNPYSFFTKLFKLSKKYNIPIQNISGTIDDNIKITGQTSSIKDLKKFIDSIMKIESTSSANLESLKSVGKKKDTFEYTIRCT